ncbi:MAG: sulfatase-like hydrolase/transferase [bacterium]|nr:sulfatase-like hydrolase/transferase [bacterium]
MMNRTQRSQSSNHFLRFLMGATLLQALALAACTPAPPRNLVLISLDTTRADHLPTYGYPRDTAPRIDRLAHDSFVFLNAVAQWTTTNPSHTSMFSGLYPHTHGVGKNTRHLAQEHTTLAEILRGAGFRTGAFVSGYPLRLTKEGLGQGFEVYDGDFKKMRRKGRLTTDLALGWLRERLPEERFFLFLHLYDAHGAYKPKGEYRDLFRSADPGPLLDKIPGYQQRRDDHGQLIRHLNAYVDRYDAQIRYQDDLVADVLAALDLERTILLITSDHGETLGERARVLDHGKNLFDEQIRIPLILHVPGNAGARLTEPVETVDFLPTLIELLGVPAPSTLEVQGESLVPMMRSSQDQRRDGLAFSSVRAWARSHADRGYFLDGERRIHSVRGQRWKLIVYPGLEEDYLELYDLESDPLERRSVAEQYPDVRDQLKQAMDSWNRSEVETAVEPELSAEERENLKALGYLGD